MAGRHRRPGRRTTETSEYVAMMLRIYGAWAERVAADPAALAHLGELQQAFTDATNTGIFRANRDSQHYSQNELAAILGVSRQAIAKRIGLGELAYAAAQARAGAGPMVRLADIRARRAAGLAAAHVADVTGSQRERGARAS